MLGCLWVLILPIVVPAGVDAKGVTAEKWINRLTIRFDGDARTVILFFDSKQTQDLRDSVERLNKIARRNDVVVIGVTPEREDRAREVIRKFGMRFAVGVQSSSYKAFNVKRFPQVVYIERNKVTAIEDFDWVERQLGDPPDMNSGSPEELDEESLMELIDVQDRLDLLETLRIRTDPGEFVSYCDRLAAKRDEGLPWWSGELQYQRHLADATETPKQPESTPARDARREARRSGTRKREELAELYESRDSWSYDDVMEVYTRHIGDDPEDMVYRADWVLQLGRSDDPTHVPALLDMLNQENDAANRGLISFAIGEIHTTSALADPEYVIRRLEKHLETEENIRWGRPAVELTIDLLRRFPEEFEVEPEK